MSQDVRNVKVRGPGQVGYVIEAEYHPNSGPDRDAVLAFVERIVRVLEGEGIEEEEEGSKE